MCLGASVVARIVEADLFEGDVRPCRTRLWDESESSLMGDTMGAGGGRCADRVGKQSGKP